MYEVSIKPIENGWIARVEKDYERVETYHQDLDDAADWVSLKLKEKIRNEQDNQDQD